jgi:hypothetical protein
MIGEVVKPIPGVNGWYATNAGNVIGRKGKYIGSDLGGQWFCGGSTLGTSIKRSKLILLTFSGPAPEGMNTIEHINGDLLDDRPENLKWTKKMN